MEEGEKDLRPSNDEQTKIRVEHIEVTLASPHKLVEQVLENSSTAQEFTLTAVAKRSCEVRILHF